MKQNDEILDAKIVKKHYPRQNCERMLEFVFEKDPNLFLRQNKIIIRGFIRLNDDFVVENGWVSKLFSSLKVEIDSTNVSINRSK